MASARDLGQAYVSIVPNLDKFKSQLQTGLKKAVAGTKADVEISADTKPLTDGVKKASKEVNVDLVKLRDQAKSILADGLKFDVDADDTKAVAKIDGLKAKLIEFSKMDVEGKTDLDVAKAQAKLSALDAELDAFSKKHPTATANVKVDRSLLSRLWSGVEKDAHDAGDKSGEGFAKRLERALGGSGEGGGIAGAFARLFDPADKEGDDAGDKSGNSFVKSLVSHIGNQGYWIAGAVAVGLAALPAAIGVVGALSGVALGAGIIALAVSEITANGKAITAAQTKVLSDQKAVASASKVTGAATPNSLLSQQGSNAVLSNTIKQLEATKKLTAAQKLTLSNDKISLATGQKKLSNLQAQNGTTAKGLTQDQQKLKGDQQTLQGLEQQQKALIKFQNVYNDLKDQWTSLKSILFSSVANSGFLGDADKAVKGLSKGLSFLKPELTGLFKTSGKEIQPFVTSLEDLIKGVLPGLTSMLGKTQGPLSNLIVSIGKIVGSGLGQWFETAAQYISKLSSQYFIMLLKGAVNLGTGIIKLGGILSQILVPVIKLLEPIVAKLVGNFGKTGTTLIAILVPAIEKIGPPLVKLAASLLTVSAEFTGTFLVALKPVVQGLSTMIAVTANFIAQHPAIVQAIVAVALAWKVLTVAIEISKAAFESTPWGLIITGIVIGAALIIRYWTPISHFFEMIWNNVYSGFIKPLVAFFTNSVPHAFDVTLKWLKSNWPLLIGIVGGPVAEIVGVIIKYHTQIANTFTTLWNEVKSITVGAWEAVVNYLHGVWSNLVNGLSKDLSMLKAGLSAAWNWCKNTTVSVWNDVKNYYGGLWNNLVNGLKTDLSVLKAALSAAWNWCKNITSSVWGAIKSFFSGTWNAIVGAMKSALSGLKGALSAAWNWCRSITSTAWEAIKSYFSNVWNNIKGDFSNSLSNVKSAVSGAWNAVFSTTKSVFGKVTSFFEGFWKGLKNGFADVVQGIKSAWSGVTAAVQKPLQAMDNAIYAPFAHLVNAGLGIFGVKAKLPAHLIAQQKAVGGMVDGRGNGISDNIPVMMSPGEYVMKASTVRKVGKKNLDMLNGQSGKDQGTTVRGQGATGGTPKFVTGGQLVDAAVPYKGHPYVWGGPANPKNGWDCSSFMSYLLGSNGIKLPDGFKAPSNQHGPVATEFRSGAPQNLKNIVAGDIAVEKNGGHVGLIAANGQKNTTNQTSIQGFAAKGKAYGTVPQVFGTTDYDFYKNPGTDNRGVLGQLWDGAKNIWGDVAQTLTSAASSALGDVSGLLGKLGNGGKTIPTQLATGVAKKFLTAGTSNINSTASNWQSGNPSVGDSDVGTAAASAAQSGSEMANGRAIYTYLLQNLFSGNKIAAAGATASIWGESTWNPFAQGTGGRGLIGWTPPSAISNEAYNAGLSGQLPQIIDFVNKSGDQSVIAAMMKASTVAQAAQLWGKGVERYGINDVHSTGISLATGFMGGKFGGGPIHTPAPGVPKADQWNVNVADGEKVLTRSQAQDYGKVAPQQLTPGEQAILTELRKHTQSLGVTAQATSSTAQATGGLNRVKRLH